MSLGNTYNNNQSRQSNPIVDGTTYSDYRMNNPDSTIDASCLAPRFWKQNLCLSIYPRKKTGNACSRRRWQSGNWRRRACHGQIRRIRPAGRRSAYSR